MRLTEDFERTPHAKPTSDGWNYDRKIFSDSTFSMRPLGTFRLTIIDDELYSNDKSSKLSNLNEESVDKLDALIERAVRRRASHKANLQATWEQNAADAAKRDQQREAELAAARRSEEELKRRESLLSEARLWRQCEDARAYVAAVQQAAPHVRAETAAWLSWTMETIALMDPLVKRVRTTRATRRSSAGTSLTSGSTESPSKPHRYFS